MRTGLLWFSFLGGPLAWATHLLASYPLVSAACESGSTATLNAITAVTLTVSLAAAAVGVVGLRRLRPGSGSMAGDGSAASGGAGPRDPGASTGAAVRERRAYFMALCGALLGTLFAIAIVAEGLPPLLQDPCLLAGGSVLLGRPHDEQRPGRLL